jgi:hypothetical protein
MNRKYITDAITAILEDIFGFRMTVPSNEEFEAFFDPEQFDHFRKLVRQEFDLEDDILVDSTSTFRELILLIEDEIFP